MNKILVLLLFGFGHLCNAQDCDTQAANKPSVLKRSADHYQHQGVTQTTKPASLDITNMKVTLSKTEAWSKALLTGFTGAELDYYNNFSFDPLDLTSDNSETASYAQQFYMATGIKGYFYSRIPFYAYYCRDNKFPIDREDESGSSVIVAFNNLLIGGLSTGPGSVSINGKIVFEIFEKSRSEGRIDYYDLRAVYNDHPLYTSYQEIIIIRNSDKPVFVPIRRREYLEQMLKDVEVYRIKKTDFLKTFYETSVSNFEKEMQVYKANDKSFTAEKEAKRRAWFAEDINPEKLQKDLKKVDDEVDAAKQILAEYLNKPDDWLSRGLPSLYRTSFESYHSGALREYFDGLDVFTESKEDKTRTEIVLINPDYFNKNLNKDVPQVILVSLKKSRYPHMQKVADLIHKPGALKPLEALLYPGTTP